MEMDARIVADLDYAFRHAKDLVKTRIILTYPQ